MGVELGASNSDPGRDEADGAVGRVGGDGVRTKVERSSMWVSREMHGGAQGLRDDVVLGLGRVLSVTVECHRLYEHDERGH